MPKSLSRQRRYSFRTHPNIPATARPLSDLNITPLIDVLLVLLVMIMLSIPIATHKVEVDISAGTGTGEPPIINRLRLNAAGETSWNGAPIEMTALKTELRKMARDPAKPQLHLQADSAARYGEFDHLVAAIKRSGVQQVGFIGNERFARWDEM